MTSKNMTSDAVRRPFLLAPACKDYLWGGDKLKTDYGKVSDLDPLAETWECSTHPDGPSTVASGEYTGLTLSEVLTAHPEYLGTHPAFFAPNLPILIKLIDAKKDLSVQVHPDDAYAAAHENGSLGKTEMWYVLNAAPGAKLVYGFNRDTDREMIRNSISNGTLEKYLQKVQVQKDDLFFVEAGTVHALGAGTLVAEIQENSNLTYRLYDYNRRDKRGNLRELHVEKALNVLHYESSEAPRQPMRVLRYRPGYATELLCRCKYFQAERMLINTENTRNMAEITVGANSFQVLLCVDGCGMLLESDSSAIPIFKGSCIFLPAECAPVKLHGKAQLLKIEC